MDISSISPPLDAIYLRMVKNFQQNPSHNSLQKIFKNQASRSRLGARLLNPRLRGLSEQPILFRPGDGGGRLRPGWR